MWLAVAGGSTADAGLLLFSSSCWDSGILAGFLFFSPAKIVATFKVHTSHYKHPTCRASCLYLRGSSGLVVARLASVSEPVWQPLGRQFTILFAVSFSSLRKWTARTRITHGDSDCCLEAFCLSTLEALLPVWQNLHLLILFRFGLTNNGRRYQASWQLVPKQEGPPLS